MGRPARRGAGRRQRELVIGMTKFSDEQRERILAEARATLERTPERYVPADEPVRYRTYDPGPPELEPERPRRLDTRAPATGADTAADWSGWESWLQTRLDTALAAERQELLRALTRIVGTALGRSLADAREESQRELHEQVRGLRTELVQVEETLQQLRGVITLERSRTIDLPALPRRDLN